MSERKEQKKLARQLKRDNQQNPAVYKPLAVLSPEKKQYLKRFGSKPKK